MSQGTIDYIHLWDSAAANIDKFCQKFSDACARAYRDDVGPDAELVTIALDNGFSYLFDLADTFATDVSDIDDARVPRVVATWGLSRYPEGPRDKSRMAGFPPVRPDENKGHLISRGAGGGYDINLVPMNAALNLGRSPEGKVFRAMERYSAHHPGVLFFIRLLYEDQSDRSAILEVGLQRPDRLQVERFANS